ncbi:gamma-secretase subunit APH-1B isoform X6 [Bubalus kerabau]|uniref:gamma-secretase subunit APH-1B isoform X6 n=1 Tax=Bubalus carabanensis TaxID=3119969 RepID=UPI00244E9A8B|nr:gamma-secretase subunit APH-1B isoform X6 [Bubalus carabanensis]
MTAAVFFGCAFIAFGPALALYIFTIVTEPLRIIFLIIGAFFWLVSLLFSSFIWFTTATLIGNKDEPREKYLLIFGVLISVLIQEMFRFAYYKLLKKASEGLKTINPYEKAPSMRLLAYVSGLGFGIMSGVFSFVNTLSDSLGPGTVGIHGDPPQFFLYSDVQAEMAEKPEIKLPTFAGSSKKEESSRKTSISALLTMPKPLTVWITINCGKF